MRSISCLVMFAALILLPAVGMAAGDAPQAPFGDKVSAALLNYNRAAPSVGSAGRLEAGGVAEAKALGFATIIDLRGPAEGIEAEKAEAEKAGIGYVNVPITDKAPTEAQVRQVAAILADKSKLPVLIHCQSGNRVGAFWALYRAANGVPAEVALEEGQTLGLGGSREEAVRARLGLAPAKTQ